MEAMGGESLPPDLSAPTVVHRVRAKFGYSEVHVPAPGFADHVSLPNCLIPLSALPVCH